MLQPHYIVLNGEMILRLSGFLRVGIEHLIAVLMLGSLLEREIAAPGKHLHLLELVRLGHGKPDIERLAGIGDANGERVIQLKVARLGLSKGGKAQQKRKRDRRNSARHGTKHGNSSFRL